MKQTRLNNKFFNSFQNFLVKSEKKRRAIVVI